MTDRDHWEIIEWYCRFLLKGGLAAWMDAPPAVRVTWLRAAAEKFRELAEDIKRECDDRP